MLSLRVEGVLKCDRLGMQAMHFALLGVDVVDPVVPW